MRSYKSSRILFTLFLTFNIVHFAHADGGKRKKDGMVTDLQIRNWFQTLGVTEEEIRVWLNGLLEDDEFPDDNMLLVSQGASEDAATTFDLGLQIQDEPILWRKSLSKAMWKKFWAPFLAGCKPDILKKWFEGDYDDDSGGAAASAASGSPFYASQIQKSSKSIVDKWSEDKKKKGTHPVPDISGPLAISAKRSYVVELADFYYDEKVEEARKERSWLILNEQKKRAQRASAHGSIYANDLLYDYYENVDVEAQREQSATDQLQRERGEIREKRTKLLAKKNSVKKGASRNPQEASLRRKRYKRYNY